MSGEKRTTSIIMGHQPWKLCAAVSGYGGSTDIVEAVGCRIGLRWPHWYSGSCVAAVSGYGGSIDIVEAVWLPYPVTVAPPIQWKLCDCHIRLRWLHWNSGSYVLPYPVTVAPLIQQGHKLLRRQRACNAPFFQTVQVILLPWAGEQMTGRMTGIGDPVARRTK